MGSDRTGHIHAQHRSHLNEFFSKSPLRDGLPTFAASAFLGGHGCIAILGTLTGTSALSDPSTPIAASVLTASRGISCVLDRLASKRPGYLGGLPFVRVFERQEKRHQRTGETAIHLHALVAGIQYRGDRLGGRARRAHYRKAEELGLDGVAVTKAELQGLAERYGFGPMLDITQVQASPENPSSAFEVAKYLGKYLAKFENLAEWLPKNKQVVTGSLGNHYWAGPGGGEVVEPPAEPEQMELPLPWPPPRIQRRWKT